MKKFKKQQLVNSKKSLDLILLNYISLNIKKIIKKKMKKLIIIPIKTNKINNNNNNKIKIQDLKNKIYIKQL